MAQEETSTTTTTSTVVLAAQGQGIMISYQELVLIRTELVKQGAKLDACLALKGTVEGIEKRLGKVENMLSGKAGERRVWSLVMGFLIGTVTAVVGGGAVVFFNFLPKHWGG